MQRKWPEFCILNVNFPANEIRECQQTFISKHLVYEANIERTENGTFKYTTYTKRNVSPEQGSDQRALDDGYVSVSVLGDDCRPMVEQIMRLE